MVTSGSYSPNFQSRNKEMLERFTFLRALIELAEPLNPRSSSAASQVLKYIKDDLQ